MSSIARELWKSRPTLEWEGVTTFVFAMVRRYPNGETSGMLWYPVVVWWN